MADMMETLKNMLGDNAEEKINSVMNMLSSEKADSTPPAVPPNDNSNMLSPDDLASQAQTLLSRLSSGGDDRSNLLMSLKPYMRESRKKSIDSAVKLLNMAQLSEFFKGGI